jgi:hypothetical protein
MMSSRPRLVSARTWSAADLARQQWDTEADLILTERAAATGITISLMLANNRARSRASSS